MKYIPVDVIINRQSKRKIDEIKSLDLVSITFMSLLRDFEYLKPSNNLKILSNLYNLKILLSATNNETKKGAITNKSINAIGVKK